MVRLEPLLIGGLYPKNLEDRILIKIDQVPPYLLETLVAVEDRDFYHHFGVSPKSIARADLGQHFWRPACARAAVP